LFTEAFKTARAYGKKTIFAPSIIMVRKRKDQFAKMKTDFDVAVMNKEEASLLTGTHKLLDALHELPGKLNVITCDVDGTYVVEDGSVWHVPTIKVKVLDTTGAGDAFTGALVHGVLNHDDAVEAVKLATATACWNIMMPGAKVRGTKEEIMEFRKKSDGKLREKRIN
ncbi:carbohydrate kinase family protein, partial [Candidatus Micrarchaeota archaeon]|nr:carbohydrate kinase family protein [Candidatus Micrarchaeota archaeon]